jgi:YVTN family beta-propeller protein
MATIAVGILPSGVVVAPDGRHAYVSNLQRSGGVVNVIDTTSNAVVDSITVSAPTGLPHGLAMTPDGCQLYVVAETGEDTGQGAVKVIDVNTKATIATVAMAPCESQSDVAITPDGRLAYVLDAAGFGPAVIDTTTHDVSFPLRTGIACGRMAITPNGLLAYLVSDTVDSGEVYDLATRKIVTAFDLFGGHSTDVAVTPDGRHAYVTQRPGNSAGGRLLVIDTATQKRVDPPIKVPGSADGLAFMPNGQAAYVSDSRSRAVHVVAVRP